MVNHVKMVVVANIAKKIIETGNHKNAEITTFLDDELLEVSTDGNVVLMRFSDEICREFDGARYNLNRVIKGGYKCDVNAASPLIHLNESDISIDCQMQIDRLISYLNQAIKYNLVTNGNASISIVTHRHDLDEVVIGIIEETTFFKVACVETVIGAKVRDFQDVGATPYIYTFSTMQPMPEQTDGSITND